MLYHCYTGLEGYVLGGLKLKTQQKTHAAIQWFKFLSYPFTISHSVCACVCVSLCFFNWGLPFPVLFVVDVAWFTTTWRTVRLSVNLIEASLIPALLKLHWKTTDSSYFLVILCHHMQSSNMNRTVSNMKSFVDLEESFCDAQGIGGPSGSADGEVLSTVRGRRCQVRCSQKSVDHTTPSSGHKPHPEALATWDDKWRKASHVIYLNLFAVSC